MWFRLKMQNDTLMEEPGVADFLEACDRIMYSEFSRNRFYECLSEMALDMHGPGNGFGYIEEDQSDPKRPRILFQARHYKGIWIEENAAGDVDTLLEEIPMALRDVAARFGGKLPQEVLDRAKKAPFDTYLVKHLTKPRDERFAQFAQTPFDENMRFNSIWYDEKEKRILDVGGYWEFPWLVARYAKNAGDPYAHSPGQYALGDMMGANQMTKSRIRLGNIIADPTLIVDEKLEGQDDVLPGGRIYTKKDTQRVEALNIGANYPIAIDNEERQDRIIDEHFNVQIYLMLQQADGKMTAREVVERMGEKAAVLSHVTGRFLGEVLQPAIRRTFNLLLRSGRLPPLPPALAEAREEAGLDIEFIGFFSQVQKKYYATNGVNSALEYAGAFAQVFGPEPLDNIDPDVLLREGLDASGAPQRAIRETRDVKKTRQARAEAVQAAKEEQKQMIGQQAIMQNMDKLGKKPEDGSPLAAMDAAQAGGPAAMPANPLTGGAA